MMVLAWTGIIGSHSQAAKVQHQQKPVITQAMVKQSRLDERANQEISRVVNASIYQANVQYLNNVKALQDKKAADDEARLAAERAAAAKRQTSYSRGAVSGSCAAMKPAGFPDYIIQRESGGDPNATNPNGGAYGCAQIMPFHFRPGGSCYGLDYASCWAKLWAGGAGASHWACTRESGCLR